MRHDHNSSLWTTAEPRRRLWPRRLALAGVASVVAVIAAVPLVDRVSRPSAACMQAWPYLDAGCVGADSTTTAALQTRPVRVIGIDRNAPVVIAKPASAPLIEKASGAAPAPPAASDMVAPAVLTPIAAAAPSTDGSGRTDSVPRPAAALPRPTEVAVDPQVAAEAHPPAAAVVPISEEDLTFKTGAVHRPGAAAATKEAVREEAEPEPAPRKTKKPRRTASQRYDLPDGRQATVHRRYPDGPDPNGRRLRAAEGPRFDGSYGGFFGGRREPGGLGGLY